MKSDELFISVKKVDRAVFPVQSVLNRYPLEAPTRLPADNDERRVRAIAIAALEEQAMLGNTIFPVNLLVDKMRELILEPECRVTADLMVAIDKFIAPEILKRKMRDGTEYYKLVRIN